MGAARGANTYAFADNDPINGADPYGLHWIGGGVVEQFRLFSPIRPSRPSAPPTAASTGPISYSDPFGLSECSKADGWTGCKRPDDKPLEPQGEWLDKAALIIGLFGGETEAAGAVVGIEEASSLQGARLATHLEQLEEYGVGGVRALESGRIRYYGELKQAATRGEMVGRRLVREWDPVSGLKRTWHETLDAAGTVRQIRPQLSEKIHHVFDEAGRYVGRW